MMGSLRKHWSILRLSWRAQNEADKGARPRTDHEFLPAALEIMEKPPSPGLRWLLLTLCGLFAVALLWASIGRVDVVAIASGKVIPAANSKTIQAMELGSVRAIHVKNGQHVRKGELLIELDPTMAGADAEQSGQQLESAEVIRARNAALLAYLGGTSPRFARPASTSADTARTEDQFVRTSIAEYEAERASLIQQRAEHAGELAAAEAEIAKIEQTIPLVEKQMAARRELAAKGYFSKIRLLEYEQLQVEHTRNLDVQRANAAKARAAIGTVNAQLVKLRETFGREAVAHVAEASDKAGLAAAELRKTKQREAFQQLRSPVDGTVQQLIVTTIGGVVQPAQALMVIVPDDAALAVEAYVLNRDIGFVKTGQKVRVKIEAFPFTDFGLIEGTVETVSRDAIDIGQQPAEPAQGNRDGRANGGRPAPSGLVYATRIRLDCAAANPKRAPLCTRIGPGMSVQAEIKTGTRRIIQYLLSPITQSLDEAARER